MQLAGETGAAIAHLERPVHGHAGSDVAELQQGRRHLKHGRAAG